LIRPELERAHEAHLDLLERALDFAGIGATARNAARMRVANFMRGV
jgi:hypothetical protein